jgi:hypothetical protein
VINVKREGEKRECQPSNFDLLSSFFLEIRDNLGPVAVHVKERRYNEDERE